MVATRSLLLTACLVFAATTVCAQGDVVSTAKDAGSFPTLVAAVSKFPDIADALSNSSAAFTVFAPNEDAFMKIIETLDPPEPGTLLELGSLADILQFHVLEGKVMEADITDGVTVSTLAGLPLKIGVDGPIVSLDGGKATVVQADIPAGENSVIHVIDAVLMPPESSPESGEADDPADEEGSESKDDEDAGEEGGDIVENVVQAVTESGVFPSLLAAVGKFPEIVEALSDSNAKLTVFAPNEDAIKGVIDTLDPPEAATLLDLATLPDILKYHVIPGSKIMSLDLKEGDEAEVETLLGKMLKVKVENGEVVLNDGDAKVTETDIEAGPNAVIHAIDAVLMPPEDD